MKKRVVSLSLYKAPSDWETSMGTNFNKYVNGLFENINLIKEFYPDWHIYLYHNQDFDVTELVNKVNYDKFETKLITDTSISAMQWRFLPNDDEDVELFIVRDADSRITQREKTSVEEWIKSGKILHIMRDHPHHTYSILGGMWGMARQPEFNISESVIKYNIEKGYNHTQNWFDKWWDMNYLRDVIYPKYINDSFINAAYYRIEAWATDFTVSREDNKFIGEIYDENNNRGYHHTIL